MHGHGGSAVVDLGQIGIVGPTNERDVLDGVVATAGERMTMVELEPVTRSAPLAVVVHVAAAASLAFVHGSPDGGRDKTRLGGSVGFRESLPGVLR
jgi:hypothetical protein